MLNYLIKLFIDDDFKTPTRGVNKVIDGYGLVDSSLFVGKSFFKPIELILNLDKRLKDISSKELYNLFSQFGKCKLSDKGDLRFNLNNPFDIYNIHIMDKNRISIMYKYCPISSVFLFDRDDCIEIHISPYTKNYWTISEGEWHKFLHYIDNNLEKSKVRDKKIDEILGDYNPYINLIRQLSFIVSEQHLKSNRFYDSVLNYYNTKGFISDKQAKAISKGLWN